MSLLIEDDERRALLKRFAAAGGGPPAPGFQRQPIHTLYGGAQLFRSGTFSRVGELALGSFRLMAPGPEQLSSVFGVPEPHAERLHRRVQEKLEREPVEDYRIDFEDGFGIRSGAEEDSFAHTAAMELAAAFAGHQLPPFCGIRVKALSPDSASRSLRTLEHFLSSFLGAGGGRLPAHFLVTLPKVTHVEQALGLREALELFERRAALPALSLKMELMIESPAALLGTSGVCPIPGWVRECGERLVALHFGAYDYSSALGIAGTLQRLDHPACDFARQLLLLATRGGRLWLADGATIRLPVPRHKKPVDRAQEEENRELLRRAWQESHRNVTRALESGIYQGWDLHPAQIPARVLAVYGFYLRELPAAAVRLRHFLEQSARAVVLGGSFDDAASAQGLLDFLLRGLACGALTESDCREHGLEPGELREGSFHRILAKRSG